MITAQSELVDIQCGDGVYNMNLPFPATLMLVALFMPPLTPGILVSNDRLSGSVYALHETMLWRDKINITQDPKEAHSLPNSQTNFPPPLLFTCSSSRLFIHCPLKPSSLRL